MSENGLSEQAARGGVRIERVSGRPDKDVLRQVAAIHREAIPGGFLSSFPDAVLIRLYKAMATSRWSFLFLAWDGPRLVGFVGCSENTSAFYKHFMVRHAPLVALPVLRRLVSISTVRKVVETLRYPQQEAVADLPASEILNFCVRDGVRGKGIGGRLFEALCGEFARRGVGRIRIVTGTEQKIAQHFYERRGATLASGLQVHEGHESLVYVYDVPRL